MAGHKHYCNSIPVFLNNFTALFKLPLKWTTQTTPDQNMLQD